jgi:site-specific DNA-methyltransferase (adenine-specific)
MQEHSGITISQSKEVLGSARFITGEVEIVNTATADKPHLGRRAMVPTFAAWQKIKPLLAVEAPEWIEALVKEPPKPAIEHPNEWNSGKGQGTSGTNEHVGWGTALKPAHEPIVVARKPLIGTVAQNVLEHGVGGINVDACRIGYKDEADGGDWDRFSGHQSTKTIRARLDGNHDVDLPERVDNGKQDGRWPANIILDEYTATLLPESNATGSGKASGFRKGGGDGNSVGLAGIKNAADGFSDSGSVSRFFYVAKASKRDRNEGLQELETRHNGKMMRPGNNTQEKASEGFERFNTQPSQNFHPTVKPTALMQYLIRLVTPANGVVLDPFAGSGSTGKAAILERKHFIGIEITPEYLPIIEGRFTHAYETLDSKEDLF